MQNLTRYALAASLALLLVPGASALGAGSLVSIDAQVDASAATGLVERAAADVDALAARADADARAAAATAEEGAKTSAQASASGAARAFAKLQGAFEQISGFASGLAARLQLSASARLA